MSTPTIQLLTDTTNVIKISRVRDEEAQEWLDDADNVTAVADFLDANRQLVDGLSGIDLELKPDRTKSRVEYTAAIDTTDLDLSTVAYLSVEVTRASGVTRTRLFRVTVTDG
jgi:hypothetical protein